MFNGDDNPLNNLDFDLDNDLFWILCTMFERDKEIDNLTTLFKEKREEALQVSKADEITAKTTKYLSENFSNLKHNVQGLVKPLRDNMNKMDKAEFQILQKRYSNFITKMKKIEDDLDFIVKKTIPKLENSENFERLSNVKIMPIHLKQFSSAGLYNWLNEATEVVSQSGCIGSHIGLNYFVSSLRTFNESEINRLVEEKAIKSVQTLVKYLRENYGTPSYIESLLISKIKSLGIISCYDETLSEIQANLAKAEIRDSVFNQYICTVKYLRKLNLHDTVEFSLSNGLNTLTFLKYLVSTFDPKSRNEIIQTFNNKVLDIEERILVVHKFHKNQLEVLTSTNKDYNIVLQ